MMVATAGMAVAGKETAPPAKRPPAKVKPGAADQAAAPDGKTAADQAEAAGAGDEAAIDPLASLPHVVGPKRVDLGHNAQLDLPAGMVLFERAVAQDLVRKGGGAADHLVAAIVPAQGAARWEVLIEASDVGYVSDNDASELDAQSMLEQFKSGTLEQNKHRVAIGVPELFIDGWSERPRYDGMTRHLVWGLNVHDTDGKVVNFFTRFLGRNGYLSINLIDAPSSIEASKTEALSILTAVHFMPGFRYEDHVGSDPDSGLGLKALVLGGTGVVIAKKTGILVAILLGLKKGIIVVFAAIGGFFKWLFGRRKRESEVELATSVAPEPPSGPPPDLGGPPAG
jgi:uncharacterized membrane-anchored protein